MAQLSSPGVSVSVIDESFYTPGAPGTVPLIVVASQANKMNSAGTGIAPGTLAANAGKVYLLTSQMDLGNTFGTPYFQTDAANNPVNAGELNEYGLQAAYSFLGVSNRAYVVRADVDTSQLVARTAAPTGLPENGTYWFDIADTNFGVFQWSSDAATVTGGQTFTNQSVTTLTADDASLIDSGTGAPKASYGKIGQYTFVANTTLIKLWFKNYAGAWVEVGSTNWVKSWPTIAGTKASTSLANPLAAGEPKTFNGAITSQTLTVTSPLVGALAAGDLLSFTNATPNTLIQYQITATGSADGTVTYASGGAPGINSFNVVDPTDLVDGMLIVGTGVPAGTTITVAANTITLLDHNGNPANLTVQADGDYDYFTPGGVGTYHINQLYASPVTTTSMSVTDTGDTITINGHVVGGVTSAAALKDAINSAAIPGVTATAINDMLQVYSTGDDLVVTTGGTLGSKLGFASSGTFAAPMLTVGPHTSIPTYGSYVNSQTLVNGNPTGSLWIKTTPVNMGANWVIKKYNSATASWVLQSSQLFASGSAALAALDPRGGGVNLPAGALFVKYNDDEATPAYANFKIYTRSGVGETNIVSKVVTTGTLTTGAKVFSISASVVGSSAMSTPVSITTPSLAGTAADAATIVTAINTTQGLDTNIVANLNGDNSITISHLAGGDINFVDETGTVIGSLFTAGTTANFFGSPSMMAHEFYASLWTPTVGGVSFAAASLTPPTTTPADQTLWYNSDITEVDILVNDGMSWRGYASTAGAAVVNGGVGGTSTDPMGPIVSASKPTVQSDGTALAHGDLWIDTSDLENFPTIHKFNLVTMKWVLVDKADQTTGNGIVFADARWNVQPSSGVSTGTGDATDIATLLKSNFVDFDAPEAALYPAGTMLWNLRRSGFNVKKYVKNYVDVTALNTEFSNELMTSYYPDRWVSDAANQLDGSGTFGRKAQRAVVLQALTATIESNQNIRQPDTVIFNLISCPGYLETLKPLIGLNTDNGQSAFIVADSPARLTPDATSLSNWGNNTDGAAVDGEIGLVATDSYAAVYYPWGYTQDLTGNNVVVPPSHIMLRTIALSDNVSYPWFAPAGVRRGGVTNASSVGYVDGSTGEFHTVALNGGQRDTLAAIHVNPITYLSGTGLVVYGQYTRQLVASSLDRINVARLVIYLRYQLNKIAKPFIFEPNDTITRNEIKNQIEKMLLELVGQRALYDYIVVCDKSNNTPARIDRNELHVDIAIEPVKAVEFIYIPMRLENTGAIAGLGA